MTDTDTADAAATAAQIRRLADAGAELVRVTVDRSEAAAAVPQIRTRVDDSGCPVPLVGDLHFNGHRILCDHPDCAAALDKIRINPGNVGTGDRRDANFETLCSIARDTGLAVRIGVNGASLDQELVTRRMQVNRDRGLGLEARDIVVQCAVESALRSTEAALATGLGEDRIILSCKLSSPPDLIEVSRRLARATLQPLHLGLTEAGIGIRGLVWSSASMGILLAEGIGDTIRMSLTPRPDGDRCDEVTASRELLQALGLRFFAPTVIACPGCGRTTSTIFRELTERVERHIADTMPHWRDHHPGVETLRVAVMGCVVNGPGESKHADIGISLPGTGEAPRCPVYIDGELRTTIRGDADELAAQFAALVDEYVAQRFPS
jgi:(E)-4-hydroxy-3-methylbut-2-enyl-diphosphate synthase